MDTFITKTALFILVNTSPQNIFRRQKHLSIVFEILFFFLFFLSLHTSRRSHQRWYFAFKDSFVAAALHKQSLKAHRSANELSHPCLSGTRARPGAHVHARVRTCTRRSRRPGRSGRPQRIAYPISLSLGVRLGR